MFLLQVINQWGAVVGQANYIPSNQVFAMQESQELIDKRQARTRFRRLVAAQMVKLEWDELTLALDRTAYRIVHLEHETVTEDNLVQAYQAIWRNSEIYQKVFTEVEARDILRQLKSGLVLLDQANKVCGLVAGWPILQTPEADFAQLVNEPERATYLAEWGLADSSASSPYRGLGLGTFLLVIYLHILLAASQQEVVLGTAETGYGQAKRNVVRPLYEAHGFRSCRAKNGRFITKSVTQRRLDGKFGTHRSLLYRATATMIWAALQPEKESVEGFCFVEVDNSR